MVISLKKLAGEIKIDVPDLITRQMGKAIFEIISGKLKSMHENELLVLDFEAIQVIDASFIDELIIKLILLSRSSLFPFYVKLKNISQAVEINIDLVFNSFSSFNRDRIVVLSSDLFSNNSYYIGSLSEREKDILDYLRINKHSSLKDIMNLTGTRESEIKRILDELYAMRIIRKDDDIYMTV